MYGDWPRPSAKAALESPNAAALVWNEFLDVQPARDTVNVCIG